jgi:peptidoglycan/LPS O-acetylase OafA/YrhL
MNQRTYFIDRLRVVLTALVVIHHTAITYGGAGGWFYREVTDGGTPASLLLTVLCAVNQAFFMGMFFLLAGYFTPGTLARKGPRRFLQERLLRLGVPLLVFGFVLGPLTVALASVPRGASAWDEWLAMLSQGRFVIGPLWFAFALLIFAAAFTSWQAVRPLADTRSRPMPGPVSWLAAALGVGAVALALRQVVPVGTDVWGLQLGYFASYIFLFALGCAAAGPRWLEQIDRHAALPWAWLSVVVIPVLFVVAALSGGLAGRPVNFNCGLSLPAITYAFWEPFVAWGVIAGLLWQFRMRFNGPSAAWQAWGDRAYGAFIVHAPVIVALAIALRGWEAPALLKFIVVATSGVVLSFVLAGLLRRLPGARQVL